jgi:hypothetical protein
MMISKTERIKGLEQCITRYEEQIKTGKSVYTGLPLADVIIRKCRQSIPRLRLEIAELKNNDEIKQVETWIDLVKI